MANINRTDDVSQQQEVLTIFATSPNGVSGIPTGSTLMSSFIVPRAMQIQSIQATAVGVSGAPQLLMGCLRFGTSAASFVIGTTMAIPAFGTSGYMSYSLGTVGGTQLNLQKGDVLVAQQLGGTGAATLSTIVNIVVKNMQDIKTWF